MTKSTEVLEEVANDLIRMGDEIEQQISTADKSDTNRVAPVPNKQVSTDEHLKGKPT